MVHAMTDYFIYKGYYNEVKGALESKELRFSTKNNKDAVKVGDKFLFYVKDKGVLATGFYIKEIGDKKPYVAKINLLPNLYSNFKPSDQVFDTAKGKLIKITEGRYTELKTLMEMSKIHEYSDLKGWAQRKGENFEKIVFNFFSDVLRPLSEAEVKKDVTYEIGKRPFKTEILIKFRNYDILCDAFINKGEIGNKIHRFNDMYSALDSSKKAFTRFILFYSGNENELSFGKANPNGDTVILDSNAIQYYEWLLNETKLPSEPPNDYPSQIAAYHLLGELKICLQDESVIASPYLKLTDGKNILYMFKKGITEIAPVLYVARRERGKKKFYQRLLKRKKLCGTGSIDDYLSSDDDGITNDREHTTFLNSIVISPEEIKEGDNQIEIPFRYGSVAILDGQHRAYGAYLNELKMKKRNELYFTAIVDDARKSIPIETQQEYFITVNTAQTKVDPEEIWRAYGELSSYKNKLNGIVSRVVKKIEKEKLLITKKQIENQTESNRGVSFSGLCVNVVKFIRVTNSLKNKYNWGNDRDADKYVTDVFNRVNVLISVIKDTFDEENRKNFLEHDGKISVLFKLFSKISLANKNKINDNVITPYFTVLNKTLKEDKSILDKIETAGEGPREKSADMLGVLINNVLPAGVATLSVKMYGGSAHIIEEVGNLLTKLSKTFLKDEKGQYKKDEKGHNITLISSTGGWWNFSLYLNKPITSCNDFKNNVITVLFELLKEGKDIPKELDGSHIIRKINVLRTWFQHEIEHGESKDIAQKKNDVEMVVNEYLQIKRTPEELNMVQLDTLKNKMLDDVLKFFQTVYTKVAEETYTFQ